MHRTTPSHLRAQGSRAAAVERPESPDDYRLRALMPLALQQASEALDRGELPIGCVLATVDGAVLGSGRNRMRETRALTSHAELEAFADAAGKLGANASGVIMLSTLEPCVMCTGAALEAGVETIAFSVAAPADSGTTRVRPPERHGAAAPAVLSGVAVADSLALFRAWQERHAGDTSRADEHRFIAQVLAIADGSC